MQRHLKHGQGGHSREEVEAWALIRPLGSGLARPPGIHGYMGGYMRRIRDNAYSNAHGSSYVDNYLR